MGKRGFQKVLWGVGPPKGSAYPDGSLFYFKIKENKVAL